MQPSAIKPLQRLFVSLLIGLFLPACSLHWFERSLYQRLDGDIGTEALVDDFVNEVVEDDRINHFFANTDLDDFKSMLRAQICQASGGPCLYEGADMREAHEGLGIQEADFNALVEDLIVTLNKFDVPEEDQNELLSLLGPMQGDIVEARSSPPDAPTTEAAGSVPQPVMKQPATVVPQPAPEPSSPLSNQPQSAPQAKAKTPKPKVSQATSASQLGPKPQFPVNDQAPSATMLEHQPAPAVPAPIPTRPTVKAEAIPSPTAVSSTSSQQGAPDANQPQETASGQVKGRVTIRGAGNETLPSNNVIVVLEPIKPSFPLKTADGRSHVVIMKKKTYLPSHLAVQRNDKVAFHNLDKIKHNVFSATQGASFDLGTFSTGKRPATQMKKNGIVRVYCDIHPKMAAFILVTDSPFHTITDQGGRFDFKDVSPGRFKLIVWSIRAQREQTVEIMDGQIKTIDITLDTSRYQDQPHMNKKGLPYREKPAGEGDEYF